MQVSELSTTGQKHLHLIECDENEEVMYEIRKHPIGLIGIYFFGIFLALAILGVTIAANYFLNSDNAGINGELGTDLSFLKPIIAVMGGLLSIASLIMTAIAAYLYRSNVVYVTSEKIAQVLYKNIFNRKISQLSIGDVQDVTTNQSGLFSRAFNYGTLVIETAGEQSNYTFSLTPKPYEASTAIVRAHEENLKKYGN